MLPRPVGFASSATVSPTAGGNATDLLGMDFQLVLDETRGRSRSRRGLWSHGSWKERLVLGSARCDDLRSSAPRGVVYGLPISLLLWAVIAVAVWAIWLR